MTDMTPMTPRKSLRNKLEERLKNAESSARESSLEYVRTGNTENKMDALFHIQNAEIWNEAIKLLDESDIR